MVNLSLVGIFLIVATVFGQQTGFNCNQRPPLTPDIKNCCKRPTINVDKYKAQCYNSTVSTRFGGKSDDNRVFMNPCAVECIYKQGGAFNNGQFVLANMTALLRNIMPNDPDLAQVFYQGLVNCAPDVQKKMQEFEANRPLDSQGQPIKYPGPPPECSPFAVLTTFCAMRFTFINCPANLWTSSDMCNRAQDYVKNCEPMQFGGPRNRNRNRRGTRRTA